MRESSKLFLLFMRFVYAERTRENHDIYDKKSNGLYLNRQVATAVQSFYYITE